MRYNQKTNTENSPKNSESQRWGTKHNYVKKRGSREIVHTLSMRLSEMLILSRKKSYQFKTHSIFSFQNAQIT